MSTSTALIRQAIALARWAPSSHNSQPWQVRILSATPGSDEQIVHITIDDTARLRALESLDAEMALSLGLFAGLFCRALSLANVPWRCCLDDQTGLHVILGPQRGDTTPGALAAFETQVLARRTSRIPFRCSRLNDIQLAALTKTGWDQLGLGVPGRIMLYEDEATRRRVARLAEHFGALDFSNFASWSETYAHIRFQPAEKLHEGRGFSIDSLLGPLPAARRFLMRWALHPLTMQILRPFGLPRQMARALAQLVTSAPAVLVLTAPGPSVPFGDLIETGNRLAEIWISASACGVQIHPLSVLLQHKAPKAALCVELGLSGTPIFIARAGAQTPPDIAPPRIPTQAILHDAQPLPDKPSPASDERTAWIFRPAPISKTEMPILSGSPATSP